MDVKDRLLWYLRVYDGRSKLAKARTEEDIYIEFSRKEQTRMVCYMYDAIAELEQEGKIRLIPYSEMNAQQKKTYDEDQEAIYEIIKKN